MAQKSRTKKNKNSKGSKKKRKQEGNVMTDIKKMRLTPTEAGQILGCRPETVRYKMRIGEWDLGHVDPPDKDNGGVQHRYHIYLPKLYKHMGMNYQP